MAKLNINGKSLTLTVDGDTPLLWALREQAGLTGTKYGCGIGQCGACSVHINGDVQRSCSVLVKDVKPAADGKLHLTFATIGNDVPFVNAIEIAPSEPGAIRPIRILARQIGYTDQNKRVWSCDRYFHNGVLMPRTVPEKAIRA